MGGVAGSSTIEDRRMGTCHGAGDDTTEPDPAVIAREDTSEMVHLEMWLRLSGEWATLLAIGRALSGFRVTLLRHGETYGHRVQPRDILLLPLARATDENGLASTAQATRAASTAVECSITVRMLQRLAPILASRHATQCVAELYISTDQPESFTLPAEVVALAGALGLAIHVSVIETA
jgi:hypothetical protein